MKWYKYVVFISLFLIPNMVHAECSNSEIVQYQEQAKNINITYDYTEYDNSYVLFNVKIANLTPGIYIRDVQNQMDYRYTGNDISLDNYKSGNSYKFKIYSDSENCPDRYITTKYLNLPFYNKYYKDPSCKGIENFRYCQKWIKNTISYNEFSSKISEYKSSLAVEDDVISNASNYDIFNFLLEIYIKYYYIILQTIIIAGYIIIHRHNKKEDLF